MRTLLLTAALLLATEARATGQLEAALGVSPGVYTQAELVELFFADGDETTPRVYFGTNGSIMFSMRGPYGAERSKSSGATEPARHE